MNEVYIKTEHLSYQYVGAEEGGHPVLKDVSLTIPRGQFVAVLGHNGSGKSTLAKLLNLILTPSSGSITVNGKCITDETLSEEELLEIRKNMGMVFQNPDNQLIATIVEDDVAFGPENLGIPTVTLVSAVCVIAAPV